MSTIEELLRESIDEDETDARPKITLEGEIACLLDAYAAFHERHEFKPGMVVRQKPACKGYEDIGDNGLAIVVKVLPEPIVDDKAKSNDTGFLEPKDMIIGVWHTGDGKFLTFYVDSRRFEPIAEG